MPQCGDKEPEFVDLEGLDPDQQPDEIPSDADEFGSLSFEGEDTVGPAVADPLAAFVNQCSSKKIEKDKLHQLRSKNPRPSNCTALVVPQVNPCIWRELGRYQRLHDLHMQSCQGLVARGLSAVVQTKEALLKTKTPSKSDLAEINSSLTSAVALLGNSMFELSMGRRDLLKSGINKRFHALCAPSVPVTSFLFGDKVHESLKEINDTARVSRSVHRYHPYERPQQQGHNRFQQTRQPSNFRGPPAPSKGRQPERRSFPAESVRKLVEPVNVSIAGRTALFVDRWRRLTSDRFVLEAVQGIKLNFKSLPVMDRYPAASRMSAEEIDLVDKEIQSLLVKGTVCAVSPCQNQFVSNVFLVRKKSGGMRPIINLKRLNRFIEKTHFKMEYLLSFLPSLRRGMFMTSLDLSDAYFTLPIDPEFRKYPRFLWSGQLFEFRCLCFGLCSAPRVFTKVLKPVFTQLRREGICCSPYIDDSIYADEDNIIASRNTGRAKELLESLGFVVNWEKSSLIPSTKITHLGFVIDTFSMSVSLPCEKINRLKSTCLELLTAKIVSVRAIAQVTGLIVSSFLAIRFGQLHYRNLELFKLKHLRSCRDYDSLVVIEEDVILELRWWLDNVDTHNGRSISNILGLDGSEFDLYTDASKSGWGAALVQYGEVVLSASGHWSAAESSEHINLLELRAVQFGLQCFEQRLSGSIYVHCDNTSAIAYINHYGGCHNTQLNSLSRSIWLWCIGRGLDLKAVYVPGVENVLADSLSREYNENLEWSLDSEIFHKLCEWAGTPEVDMFASRLNFKLAKYYSWKPDPGCFTR